MGFSCRPGKPAGSAGLHNCNATVIFLTDLIFTTDLTLAIAVEIVGGRRPSGPFTPVVRPWYTPRSSLPTELELGAPRNFPYSRHVQRLLRNSKRLRRKSQDCLLGFARSELSLGRTFCKVAAAAPTYSEMRVRNVGHAAQAYQCATRIVAMLNPAFSRRAIRSELCRLEKQLARFAED